MKNSKSVSPEKDAEITAEKKVDNGSYVSFFGGGGAGSAKQQKTK